MRPSDISAILDRECAGATAGTYTLAMLWGPPGVGKFDDAPHLLLARFMLSVRRDGYSFQRLSRRGGGALLPSFKSGEVDVHVALDTSGSIWWCASPTRRANSPLRPRITR